MIFHIFFGLFQIDLKLFISLMIVTLRYDSSVTMHPEIASFLVEHPLEERPAWEAGRYGALRPKYLFAAPKFDKVTSAFEKHEHRRSLSRSPISPLHITRVAWGKPTTNETEQRRELPNARFFRYKKRIFLTRNHFARRPASRSAESAIASLLRFLEQIEPSVRQRGRVLPVSVERSRQSTAQAVPLRGSDKTRG